MLVKFCHWFQVFLTSVEKDIIKILTDAQSAKKKKKRMYGFLNGKLYFCVSNLQISFDIVVLIAANCCITYVW